MRHEKQLLAVIHGQTSRGDQRGRWQRSISEAIASAMGSAGEGLAQHGAGLDPFLLWPPRQLQADPESVERTRAELRAAAADAVPQPARPSRRSRLLSLPVALWAWIAEVNRCRRDRAVLEALDERMLKDIGVSRSEIYHTSRHGRFNP